MEYKNYYQTLGVSKNATAGDIKKAYRKLARKHHPDVNPGDKKAEERFKEINEAYEVLADPEKRARYDQLGDSYQEWQRRGAPDGFDWGRWTSGSPAGGRANYGGSLDDLFGQGGLGDFSDFFRAIFGDLGMGTGAARARATPRPGQDYTQPVDVTLEEAYAGTTRILQIDDRRLEVKIPAGVKTGSRVRVRGEGGAGRAGGASGNLYLKVNVVPHGVFERAGDDLHCDVTVDLYTAVLGGNVSVPTLKGSLTLKIPPETQNGRTFRLKGQGMPPLSKKGTNGDLFVRVQVKLPHDLGEKEKALFRELAHMRREGS